jgi:hypothetical protein
MVSWRRGLIGHVTVIAEIRRALKPALTEWGLDLFASGDGVGH